MGISRFRQIETKPESLKIQYSVGEVVVLDIGQYALITGYGIYDEQYWVEKYYGDCTVHLASGGWEFSCENREAMKNGVAHIVRQETDSIKVNEVIQAYIAAINDFVNMFPDSGADYSEHISYFKSLLN